MSDPPRLSWRSLRGRQTTKKMVDSAARANVYGGMSPFVRPNRLDNASRFLDARSLAIMLAALYLVKQKTTIYCGTFLGRTQYIDFCCGFADSRLESLCLGFCRSAGHRITLRA